MEPQLHNISKHGWDIARPKIVRQLCFSPRKAACDPIQKSSFAVVVENDPSSSTLEGGKAGWPPSAFKTYSVDDLHNFFGFKMNFPKECHTDQASNFIPDWNQGKDVPHIPSSAQFGNLSIALIELGGKRVKYQEKVWLAFETAFGPAADFYDTFTLEPPPPKSSETLGWTADCTSLIAQQLPKLSCAQSGSGIQFQFDGPSKGGTFIFKLSLTAPAGELSHNQWAARVTGADQTEMVAMGEGFELLPSGHPTVPTLPPDSNKPDSNRPRHLNHFEQYWPFYGAAFILILVCLLACTRRACSRTVRERSSVACSAIGSDLLAAGLCR